jgi:hypothetical protein
MSRHQIGIGAVAATILVLGANASSLNRAPAPNLAMLNSGSGERIVSIVVRTCGGGVVPHATNLTALGACGERGLGEALDVFGELAARLKQL